MVVRHKCIDFGDRWIATTPHWLLAFLCSVFKERRDTHPRRELVPGPSLFRGGEVALARSRSMSPQRANRPPGRRSTLDLCPYHVKVLAPG